MCKVPDVPSSGFYSWLRRRKAQHAIEDERLAMEAAAL